MYISSFGQLEWAHCIVWSGLVTCIKCVVMKIVEPWLWESATAALVSGLLTNWLLFFQTPWLFPQKKILIKKPEKTMETILNNSFFSFKTAMLHYFPENPILIPKEGFVFVTSIMFDKTRSNFCRIIWVAAVWWRSIWNSLGNSHKSKSLNSNPILVFTFCGRTKWEIRNLSTSDCAVMLSKR